MKSFEEFLENVPPNQPTQIETISKAELIGTSNYRYFLIMPEIKLHCDSEECGGIRFFRCIDHKIRIENKVWNDVYLNYICSNCRSSRKTFSLSVVKDEENESGNAFKYGEHPPFGPPTPPRLISLIGPDRELFLKGRRCENQGLGIGAFGYYRRVVENQKNRIFDKIIEVAQKVGAVPDALEDLQKARAETQFTKAIDQIKHGIPESLLVNGHNPLTLLHSALSEGLHDQSDDVCLELATSIRIVLVELTDRLSNALKEEQELNSAISRLLRKEKGS